MTARILDGKSIAATMRSEIAVKVEDMQQLTGHVPGLGVVLVGDDPASRSYVTGKRKACEAVGIFSREIVLPATASREEVLSAIHGLNNEDDIDGILVQLPLPDSGMEADVVESISPAKDVDGFRAANIGRMVLGLPTFIPCTPNGIVAMLRRSNIPLRGAKVVVIGRSNLVGRPLSILLSQKGVDATVTLCHSRTVGLADYTRQADIIIVAVGRPNTLTADMVRPGVVVVDVGMNRVADASKKSGYRMVGDADFDGLLEVASAITPVPGGVGPMTISMLLHNTVMAAQHRQGARA